MPRAARYIVANAIYHVYSRGMEHRHLFWSEKDYAKFLTKLQDLVKTTDVSVLSWALLPATFHLLLQTKKTPLSPFMSRLLTSYAVYHNREYERIGPLFNDRYGSRIVQPGKFFLHISRYIHLAPVHAGITPDPLRYAHTSIGEIIGDGKWKIIDPGAFEKLLKENNHTVETFKQFVDEGINDDLSKWDPFGGRKDSNEAVLGSPRYSTGVQRQVIKEKGIE